MNLRYIYCLNNRLRIAITPSNVCSNKNWIQWWISLTNIMFLGRHGVECIPLNGKKGGLPHAYILIWLIKKITPKQNVWSHLGRNTGFRHWSTLIRSRYQEHVHGPCTTYNNNYPCIKDGKCTKRYPRDLHAETVTENNGCPQCHRRSTKDGGHFTTLKVRNSDFKVDNRWVVPYSPLLSKTSNAYLSFFYETSIHQDFVMIQNCQWKNWWIILLKLDLWRGNSRGKMYYCPVYRWSLQICYLNSNVRSFRCNWLLL